MKKILIIIICIGVVIFAGVIAIGFLVEHDRQATLTESAEQAAEQAWIDLNGQKDFYEAALEASEFLAT